MRQTDKELRPSYLEQDELLIQSRNPKAFLVSLYYPKADQTAKHAAESFVLVQASHEANTHKFKDLATAFAYLETRAQGNSEGEVD